MGSFSGVTVDAFATIFDQSDVSDGLRFYGGIKNTDGANSATVRITVTDLWGDTEAQSFVLAPGVKLSFDTLTSAYMTAQVPFNHIIVDVQSTLAGFPATYEIHTLLF